MNKLVCNLLLVFTVLYPSSASAASLKGKAVYCERETPFSFLLDTYGSAVGVHFYSASSLSVFDNTDRSRLLKARYEPLNKAVKWKHKYGNLWFTLNRQSLILYIMASSSSAKYSCEAVSPKEMKTKLEESRKRETAGNKL